MSTSPAGIETFLRQTVRDARAAYKVAFDAQDFAVVAKESKEVNDAEAALERFLNARDEEPAKPVRRHA